MEPYHLAQKAIAELKTAILLLLKSHPEGLKNVQIGRKLGIYTGHKGHEGHISRTMLSIMENEGVVSQDSEKVWTINQIRGGK